MRDSDGERPVLIVGLEHGDVSELLGGETLLFETAHMEGLQPMQVRLIAGADQGRLRVRMMTAVTQERQN